MTAALVLPPAPISPEADKVRQDVRRFLEGEQASQSFVPRVDCWTSSVDREFSRKLGANGWLGMTWSAAYGGHERSALERYAVTEELLAAGAPVAGHWIADRQSGPSILRFGTEAQKLHFLPRIAAGECYFAIGMSEPDSGSDLASIRTRAVRIASGDWVLNGTKVWTTNAHVADYAIVLVRTSPVDPRNRHAGLSQLLVPLNLPGLSINPIRSLDGGHDFNEIVFQDVVVPGEMLLGEAGNGWHQVTAELAFERSGPERFLSTYPLIAAFAERVADTGNPAGQSALGRIAARMFALRHMSMRVAAALDRGELPNVPAAVVKDVGTRFESDVIREIRAVLDVDASLESSDPLERALAEAQLHAPGFTLRGGTNEILRGIVARGLGLR